MRKFGPSETRSLDFVDKWCPRRSSCVEAGSHGPEQLGAVPPQYTTLLNTHCKINIVPPRVAQICSPSRHNVVEFGPILTVSGPILAELGQFRANFGRLRANVG